MMIILENWTTVSFSSVQGTASRARRAGSRPLGSVSITGSNGYPPHAAGESAPTASILGLGERRTEPARGYSMERNSTASPGGGSDTSLSASTTLGSQLLRWSLTANLGWSIERLAVWACGVASLCTILGVSGVLSAADLSTARLRNGVIQGPASSGGRVLTFTLSGTERSMPRIDLGALLSSRCLVVSL